MHLSVPDVLNVAADASSRDNLSLFSSLLPQARPTIIPAAVSELLLARTRLGLSTLDRVVCYYFSLSIAPATLAVYRSASRCFYLFCTRIGAQSFPLQQVTLMRFVAYLADGGLSHATITTYLSRLRFEQITAGLPDPDIPSFPQLHYVVRGVQRRVIPPVVSTAYQSLQRSCSSY